MREASITIRLTKGEREAIERRAETDRRTLADYIRIKLELPIERKIGGKVDRRRKTA
jgi:hypothetical protein